MSSEEKRAVVISMDGSEHADYAFHWYMDHLRKPNHHVILLHVPERHAFTIGPLGGTADVVSIQLLMQEEEAKEKAFLERLAQKLHDSGIGGKVKSVGGKPGEVICSVAEDEHALLIICGSRGKGTFRRTFLGSTSDYVLHHSHIPVFICKHKDLHTEHVSAPSLKEKFMNSPLFRRKNKDSPKNSPKVGRKKTDSESAE